MEGYSCKLSDDLVSCIARNSFAKISDFMPPHKFEEISRIINGVYDRAHKKQGKVLHGLGLAPSLPVARTFLSAALEGGVVPVLENLLGGDVVLWTERSIVRKHYPPAANHYKLAPILPFHQDSYNHLPDFPMIVLWIAFDNCGLDSPGLEVIAAPVDEILPVEHEDLLGKAYDRVAEQEIVRRYGGAARLTPTFRPGDAILMNGFCIHRTHVAASMERSRTAAVLRFMPASVVAVAPQYQWLPIRHLLAS